MSIGFYTARRVRKEQGVSARNTNRYRAALQALQSARNSLFVSASRPWASAMLHVIDVVEDDYLTCRRVWRDGTLGVNQVEIAKPELLRSTVTSRNGVTYAYAGTDAQSRTASKSGEDDETHQVTPTYLVGDFIEVRVLRHKTGIAEVDEQRAVLIDSNVDGRAWAALAT